MDDIVYIILTNYLFLWKFLVLFDTIFFICFYLEKGDIMENNEDYTVNEQIKALYQYMSTLECFRVQDLVSKLQFYGISEDFILNYVTLCTRRNSIIEISKNIYSTNRGLKLAKMQYYSKKHK